MKPIISKLELFKHHADFFISKFMTEDFKFKSPLSSILTKEHLIKKINGFEYTYGYLRDLGFLYSIMICPDTLEGYLLIHFPSIKMNNVSYIFIPTTCFKHLQDKVDASFDIEKKKVLIQKILYSHDIENNIDNLIQSTFIKSIPHEKVKRNDQTMKIFTVYLISLHFNHLNEINLDEFKLPLFKARRETLKTLYIQEFLRMNIDKILSKKISFHSLLNIQV